MVTKGELLSVQIHNDATSLRNEFDKKVFNKIKCCKNKNFNWSSFEFQKMAPKTAPIEGRKKIYNSQIAQDIS